jgi:hypothetical protein
MKATYPNEKFKIKHNHYSKTMYEELINKQISFDIEELLVYNDNNLILLLRLDIVFDDIIISFNK